VFLLFLESLVEGTTTMKTAIQKSIKEGITPDKIIWAADQVYLKYMEMFAP